jgi:hypothetical protein
MPDDTTTDELARRHAAERRQLAERHNAERIAAGLSPLPIGRPRRGEPEYPVWIAAIDVATSPPRRANRSGGVTHALVPWDEIEKLRAALEDADVNWRQVWEGRRG